MHKLAKGLKKKKKGKKSKHKEEELFKPEELEAYRREHSNTAEGAPAQNEEWKKFISLTSGVDDILKKTQDDLSRIKSTSFFQRIPTASETQKQKEQAEHEAAAQKEEASAAQKPEEEPTSAFGIVAVSESESEEEEDDDIFDTAYIDAIATGEVKLAYIPESPTETQGDDPFDTSHAERAILGPAVERKGKKLVPLGAAVEVLTGRVQLPTCATKPVSNRRQYIKEKDLLLGSFDSSVDPPANTVAGSPDKVKTLLDDDDVPLPDEPIDLSKSLYIPPPQQVETVQQFEDDDDKEFEALAAESLSKSTVSVVTSEVFTKTVLPAGAVEDTGDWKPFENEIPSSNEPYTDDFDSALESDPFDTTFAENILPGNAELKQIEKEILENDLDFDPRAVVPPKPDFIRVPESKLNLIKPVHRDLLGGSTTDLSTLGDKPIQPTSNTTLEEIKYCDPFDTSIVEAVQAPGQAELKLLERELLGDIKETTTKQTSQPKKVVIDDDDDDDFDPRGINQQSKERTLSRPDVLNVAPVKSVSFSVPQKDLLGTEDTSKISKPLTPFYVRKNSVPGTESPALSDDLASQDPFDTSFVPNLAPGKAELKVIESELFNANAINNLSLEDPDFDPRDETKTAKIAAVEAIKEIGNPKIKAKTPEPVDLLSASNDIAVKVLTPATEIRSNLEENTLFYADPFDTTIATNLPPGKAELKLLENELISADSGRLPDQNKDLLVHTGDIIIDKPLSPVVDHGFGIEDTDFDPFDTSIANNIQPGKAELKLLESELI